MRQGSERKARQEDSKGDGDREKGRLFLRYVSFMEWTCCFTTFSHLFLMTTWLKGWLKWHQWYQNRVMKIWWRNQRKKIPLKQDPQQVSNCFSQCGLLLLTWLKFLITHILYKCVTWLLHYLITNPEHIQSLGLSCLHMLFLHEKKIVFFITMLA